MGEHYYLFEYVQGDYKNEKHIAVVGEFSTIEEALTTFNKHLKGGYLPAPNLGNFPEGYIIKGTKIPIKIIKTGIVEVDL